MNLNIHIATVMTHSVFKIDVYSIKRHSQRETRFWSENEFFLLIITSKISYYDTSFF